MVLSAVVFADVSGCGVEASVAGVDEGTSGDQVSIVPLAHEVSQGLPGLQWVCSVTCFGDSGAAGVGLWPSLVSLVGQRWGEAAVLYCSLGGGLV